MPRTEREVAISISPTTVRRGDIITVGGQHMTVQNLFNLLGGRKRIQFAEGAVLTILPGTTLTALRIAQGW
jgi:hypothetical protein